jgi:hypothetical protein
MYTYTCYPILHSPVRVSYNQPYTPLPHRPQEIILLDARPPLLPHRLPQLLSSLCCLYRALHCPITSWEIDTLLVDRDLWDEETRIGELFLAETLRGYATLFFGFGFEQALARFQLR